MTPLTIERFVYERYWPKVRVTLVPQWQKHTEYLLKMIVDRLGMHDVTTLSTEVAEGWWLYLLSKYKTPVTPNKALTRAKHIMKTAIRWELAVKNPFTDIHKRRESDHVFTPLTNAQHRMLAITAHESLRSYMLWARYTGARRSSLVRLEERDVDTSNRTVTFRETKTGDTYTIPLHPVLELWIQTAFTGNAVRRILPQYATPHTITNLFRRLTKRCGVRGFRFHDYRHNVGTQLAAHGHGTKTIMAALGHKDVRMSVRYTHVSNDVLGKAMSESI